MNDPMDDRTDGTESFDARDRHLGERMERAVSGLRAPDVAHLAMVRGRRQRTRRRLTCAAGGLAAATTLVLTVPTAATDWTGRDQDPSAPSVATDPAATAPAPGAGASGAPCGAAATGWWSRSSTQVEADLSALLPGAVRIGGTDDRGAGTWGGDLLAGGDADFASLTLLPPPGVPGGRTSLEELAEGGPCAGGSNAPMQAVEPCDQLSGLVSCQEIRSEDGALVGVITEGLEQTVVDVKDRATDRSYVLATVAVPDGGHVELYVAEGTRADRPDTVHDPADEPALTVDQVRDVVTDPVWTAPASG
ncbi:hypothetical protein AB0N29_19535 [Nocardioides sp. NPDC092400]|uniref:hypothetical protein n=1 Tax=Nocardioides sp. NPDC092400 TaxID=3155196 RepID=UPI0034365E56